MAPSYSAPTVTPARPAPLTRLGSALARPILLQLSRPAGCGCAFRKASASNSPAAVAATLPATYRACAHRAHRCRRCGRASLEFGGSGLAALGMDERMAIANMAVEAGADTCAFEGDQISRAHLTRRGRTDCAPVTADPGAAYRERIDIQLGKLSPMVARPPSPGGGIAVDALRGQRVDQIYVGNCANGSLTDLRQVAEILRGRTIAPRVRMIVVPATQKIWRAALAEGLLDVITAAGATVSPPTCGACFGGHMGILAAGETAIATTNRNFRGRMGHADLQVFLANAWVAALLRSRARSCRRIRSTLPARADHDGRDRPHPRARPSPRR